MARPLTPGQTVEFDLELIGPSLSAAPQSLPFPAVEPLGVTERVGLLAIVPGSLWTIDPSPGPGARPLAWLDFAEPRCQSKQRRPITFAAQVLMAS